MSIAAGAAAAPLAPSSAAVSPPSTAIGMATWVSSSPRLPEQSTASTTSQNKGPAGDWNLFNAHAISIMSSRNGVSHRVVSFCCSSCTRQCSPMATYRLDVMLSTSPARTLTLTPVSKLLLNVLEGSSTKGIEMIGCSSDRSTPTIGRTTSSLPDDGCGASAAAAAAAAAAADAPQPSSGRELVVRPIVGVLRSELQPIISIPLVDDPSSTFSSSLDTGVSVSVRAGDVESITSSRYVAIGLHCLVQLLQQKDTTLWLTPFLDDIMEIACALKRFQSPAGPLFWEVVEAVLCSGSRGDDDTQVAMPMAVDGGDTAAEEGANGAAAAPAAMDM
mmetsp:Transcript_31969/g.92559  ORF Transcript_31969/g.92559 Transcript_31969/m.92559 type:complete len:332 (-) Transcript_31969:163-1158(-)